MTASYCPKHPDEELCFPLGYQRGLCIVCEPHAAPVVEETRQFERTLANPPAEMVIPSGDGPPRRYRISKFAMSQRRPRR